MLLSLQPSMCVQMSEFLEKCTEMSGKRAIFPVNVAGDPLEPSQELLEVHRPYFQNDCCSFFDGRLNRPK